MNKVNKPNEDLEIIDIFEENNNISNKNNSGKTSSKNNKASNSKANNKKTKTVRKLKKGLLVQTIFCTLSIIFILICCVFYGSRLVKYYKIYNPKDESGKAISLMGNHIISTSSIVYEGEGLYLVNGNYLYKGEKVNNYVKFSNLIWRIIKINEDKSLDVILDQPINNLMWNNNVTDYSKSDINKYLNDEFLKILDKNMLSTTAVCKDKVDDISKISCKDIDTSNYVRLLNIDEFLNSKATDSSFISNTNNIWLTTRGNTRAWTTNNNSLSYSETTNTYSVKPVITLKNSNQITSGDGSKDNPYVVGNNKNEITVGSHIKLDNDIWTVYSLKDEKVYLSLANLYKKGTKTYRFDLKENKYNVENTSSLAKYLNNDFYNSLSYKNLLLDTVWYTGEYNNSYKDIYISQINAKVGLSSVTDLKFDNVQNYYLLNGTKENKIYLYGDTLIESKPTLSRAIKPSICIKKGKLKQGQGTLEDPYVLEG